MSGFGAVPQHTPRRNTCVPSGTVTVPPATALSAVMLVGSFVVTVVCEAGALNSTMTASVLLE